MSGAAEHMSSSADAFLYEKINHAEFLQESERVLLPSKGTPALVGKSSRNRLSLPSQEDTSGKIKGADAQTSPLPRLVATGLSFGSSTGTPHSSRDSFFRCVPLKAPTSSGSLPVGNQKKLSSNRATAMQPPNDASMPAAAVRDGESFLLQHCTPTPRDMEVRLHVYDLSSGYLREYGRDLVGFEVPGVYHSGVVCYGIEVYFEGGIGVASAGRTRFGDKFRAHCVGVTRKTVTEFLRWITVQAAQVNQIHDYHPVRHNCHHFSLDAVQFLLGENTNIPSYLVSTVEDVLKTDVGAAVAEALTITTLGMQSAVARQLRSRICERQHSLQMQYNVSTACGFVMLPPNSAVLFRVNDLPLARQLILGLTPYIHTLISKNMMKPAALMVVEEMASALMEGTDCIEPKMMLNYVDMVTESLSQSPVIAWGPILDGLRIVVLHKLCLISCVFHRKLMSILVLAARDFPRLSSDGRVAFLRLVCNFACSAHGAIVHSEKRYRDSWVSIVGLGLMDSSSTVVYTAACLALNLSLSIVITSTPSLKRDMKHSVGEHYALRLVTLLLCSLHLRSREQLPEPSFNMILMALYRLASSNAVAVRFIRMHAFRPRYTKLLDRCASNESRALVCLLRTLEDLYA